MNETRQNSAIAPSIPGNRPKRGWSKTSIACRHNERPPRLISEARIWRAGQRCQILLDDGGFTGANLERPALGTLLSAGIEAGKINCVVEVYKVDRLSRSLLDFCKTECPLFERHGVSFVSRDTGLQHNQFVGAV